MTTFGTPAILLMYGATALERMNRLTAPDWIVWLGDRSYSVYLWHLPVVYALAGALKRAHPHGTVWHSGAVAVIVVAIGLVSSAAYRFSEQPLRRFSKNGWSNAAPALKTAVPQPAGEA